MAFGQASSGSNIYKLPGIGGGVGILSFLGDVGSEKELSAYSNFRIGYRAHLEQRIGSFAGLFLHGFQGVLSKNERSLSRNLNFETPITEIDLNLRFYFDNNFILSRSSRFAPFISVGFGYLMFEPYGDYENENGDPYYYWDDGTIRGEAQADTNISAAEIQRDYVFETALDSGEYELSSFTIPVSAGIRFKLSDKFHADIGATYNLCQTDFIDDLAIGDNDNFLFSWCSLTYHLGANKSKDNDSNYSNTDFKQVDKSDADQDGVNDVNDHCQDTPVGIEVDSRGCPLDNDDDGVANYLDKEPNSKRGTTVDGDGISLTEERIAMNLGTDTLASIRPETSDSGINSSSYDKDSNVPMEYRSADIDGNGIISVNEISIAIDAFFEGEQDYTVDLIYELIDYFFEQ